MDFSESDIESDEGDEEEEEDQSSEEEEEEGEGDEEQSSSEEDEEDLLCGKRRDFVEALQGNYWNKTVTERLRKDGDLRFRRICRAEGKCGLCNRSNHMLSLELTCSKKEKIAVRLGGVCGSRAMLVHALTFAEPQTPEPTLKKLYGLSVTACGARVYSDERLLEECFAIRRTLGLDSI